MKSLETLRLSVVDINFDINNLIKEFKNRDLVIEELEDKVQLLEARAKETEKFVNFLHKRNEVLEKMVLEEEVS